MPHSLFDIVSAPGIALSDRQQIAIDNTEAVPPARIQALIHDYGQRLDHIENHLVAIHQSDAIELFAMLLAIWTKSKAAVLIPNPDSPLIAPLLASANKSGHEQAADGAVFIPVAPDVLADSSHLTHALFMLTSGSTGAPQLIGKSMAQLDAEIAIVEQAFGAINRDAVFASTVSRHHMYGLTLSLLWPLCRGNLLYSQTFKSLDQLPGLQTASNLAVVTSPAQLDHYAPADPKPDITALFSAGAPLTESSAQQASRDWGIAVTEVYGSTETGVIAHRSRPGATAWKTFPQTRIRRLPESGQIAVTSPATTTGATTEVVLADIISTESMSQFHLLGRSDQTIKIGGKRLSLSAVDRALSSHPWVDTAKSLQLPARHNRIGAVLKLNDIGNAALINEGKLRVTQYLKEYLKNSIETVGIPRYWRFVAKLPANSMGKHTADILTNLFFPERLPRQPEVRAIQHQDSGVLLKLHIPYNLLYFEDHFPGQGILPGVVQLQWVTGFIDTYFPRAGTFQRMENVKFQKVIRPAADIDLELTWEEEKSRFRFRYAYGGDHHASGRLVFKD